MIVTRFAPSPTGYLHIGGARTALFNYLYARHTGGKFLLRIEDTDAERNNKDAARAILDGLTWLGIKWDDEPVWQSQRSARHVEIAHALIESGAAYVDYTSKAEMDSLRAEWSAKHPNAPFRYLDNPYRNGAHVPFVPDEPPVVRFMAPRDGSTVIDDLVQGRVEVQNSELDDMIILRSDKTPTFLLACAVDDHDMGVTHVIRGDDHLSNAFRQIHIYNAMGWSPPTYAHIPLILNKEGKPLSKRDGVAGVEDYENDYLPEALFNYLLRLGWGHGDDEIISHDQAVEWFDVAKVGKNPARIDDKKLLSVNAHYIQTVRDAVLVSAIGPLKISEPAKLLDILPELRKRSKTLTDLRLMTVFLTDRPAVDVDTRAKDIATALDGEWSHDGLEAALKGYAEAQGIKLAEAAGIVRYACTGMKQHIGVYSILLALGKDESLVRLRA